MIGATAMSTLSIKLPKPLYLKLKIMAEKRATTEDLIAIEALQNYIAKLEEETPVTAYDLAKDFIGILDEGPADLSTNPKYMKGYGSSRRDK
jgi:predicted DNA-binding protein